ncbi:MAG: trypsin-like peptidase domain-containing protein [Nanoarchaeota archaeon]
MKLSLNNVLIISIGLMIIVGSSIAFYYNNKLSEQGELFDAKLSSMDKEISENINQLQETLHEDISSMKNNLTTEINLVDTSLRNFKNQNQQEINTLSSLIDEIEKQSEIKLGELKDELKSIQVKSKDFTAIIDDVITSVVSVATDKAQGSGAIIGNEGFIVTNHHVVYDANIIRVATYGGKVYDAQLIGYNSLVDIAVLKVDVSLPSLEFGNSDDVKVGEKVIALGNPAGLSFTVTEGIVSAVHRKGPNNLNIYLQTDVPINPGNSGGPLVDANSKIIGLNNFKVGGFEGLGFAIESNTVSRVANQIIDGYKEKIAQQ